MEAAVRGFLAMVVDTEPQQRTMLRLSLEADAVGPRGRSCRCGRAGRSAGSPRRSSPWRVSWATDGVRRLAVAVRAVCGIESLVWLTDVAGLTRERGGRADGVVRRRAAASRRRSSGDGLRLAMSGSHKCRVGTSRSPFPAFCSNICGVRASTRRPRVT